jgi:hypothetical protein
MKKVSEQKNSRLGKSGEAPVHILVLTDKNAACCRSLSKLPIFLCDDRTGGEPDYTLLAFLPFLNAIPQQSPSGFVFSLVGDIHTNEDFLNAMGFAHNLRVDMVVWYSFAMAAQSEDMRDLVVHEAVEFAMANNCIVIYPFLSMPLLNSPGAIPVAGVRVEDSIFRLPHPRTNSCERTQGCDFGQLDRLPARLGEIKFSDLGARSAAQNGGAWISGLVSHSGRGVVAASTKIEGRS